MDINLQLNIYKNNTLVNTFNYKDVDALKQLLKAFQQVHFKKHYTNILKANINTRYCDNEYLNINLLYSFNENIKYKYEYIFTGESLKDVYDFRI